MVLPRVAFCQGAVLRRPKSKATGAAVPRRPSEKATGRAISGRPRAQAIGETVSEQPRTQGIGEAVTERPKPTPDDGPIPCRPAPGRVPASGRDRLRARPLARPGCRATWATLSHCYLYGPLVDQVLADEQLAPLPGTVRALEDWAGPVPPGVVAGRGNLQRFAEQADGPLLLVLVDEVEGRVAFLAKNTAAFFKMSRSASSRLFSGRRRANSCSWAERLP